MVLYHLETDTLVTVEARQHGYHLVTVTNNSGTVYRCLHDSVMSAIDDAQAHYDALGDN